MSLLQTMRSGGTQHPEEIMNFLASRIVKDTGGVFGVSNGNFLTEEEAIPVMSVKVNEGFAFLRKSADDMVYPARLYDGDDSIAISSNASGNDRIDALVLYVDLGVSANADITNVAKLKIVEGTPAASPTAPTDGDIETDIGSSNPYIRIADIEVANGTVSILDADITDQREEVIFLSHATPVDDADIVNKAYADNSWIDAISEWTFGSWDATVRTAVINTASDETGNIQLGDRSTFVQPTDGVKYGIVTKITATQITLFMYEGDDLDSEDITSPKYSHIKNPYGFDIDPTKWTIEVTDITQRSQTPPTQNVWYNLGSFKIDMPIGSWNIEYDVSANSTSTSTSTGLQEVTLSDANNTESDVNFTTVAFTYVPGTGSIAKSAQHTRKRPLNLTSKSTRYLNTRTTSSVISSLRNDNDLSTGIINAECDYL